MKLTNLADFLDIDVEIGGVRLTSMFLACTTEKRKMPYIGMEEVDYDVWVTLDLFCLKFLRYKEVEISVDRGLY